jgi:uncharacterized pyridoxal phosphate-containing UPF0001 family protein
LRFVSQNQEWPCQSQFHIASEESKFGFLPDDVNQLFFVNDISDLNNIVISGVMGMATYTEDEALIKNEFSILTQLFRTIKKDYFQTDDNFREISMGMSNDYLLAIENGSTMVRIGSTIFGDRCSVG